MGGGKAQRQLLLKTMTTIMKRRKHLKRCDQKGSRVGAESEIEKWEDVARLPPQSTGNQRRKIEHLLARHLYGADARQLEQKKKKRPRRGGQRRLNAVLRDLH